MSQNTLVLRRDVYVQCLHDIALAGVIFLVSRRSADRVGQFIHDYKLVKHKILQNLNELLNFIMADSRWEAMNAYFTQMQRPKTDFKKLTKCVKRSQQPVVYQWLVSRAAAIFSDAYVSDYVLVPINDEQDCDMIHTLQEGEAGRDPVLWPKLGDGRAAELQIPDLASGGMLNLGSGNDCHLLKQLTVHVAHSTRVLPLYLPGTLEAVNREYIRFYGAIATHRLGVTSLFHDHLIRRLPPERYSLIATTMSTPATPSDEPPPSSPPATLGADSEPKSRPTTPPNTTAAVVNRTPTADKASSHNIKPKHGLYERKVVVEMKTCYHKMDYDRFMSLFAKVEGLGQPNLSEEQLSSMSAKLQDVPKRAKNRKCMPHCLNEALAQAESFAAAHAVTNATAHTTELAIPSVPDTQTTTVVPSKSRYIFKDVSNWIESNDQDLKIDIAMYPDTEDARRAFNHDMNRQHALIGACSLGVDDHGRRGEAENEISAFDLARPGLLRDSDHGRVAQAQIAKYATQLMLRQHRAFVFILYIVDNEAFITRWDRVGCIITTPIKYMEEPAKILNFVYRLALMSRNELGYDTTAELATSAEVQMLKDFAQDFKNPYVTSCATEILDNQVTCANVADTNRGEYFIGKHSVASYSPTGRATKGYVTFNKQKPKRLCFMKDYWRPNSNKIPKELDVYQKLNTEGVRYVATAIGGEDVPGQSTVTQIYLPPGEAPLERLHCRLVVEELARPLEAYNSSSDMIMILYHALQGHKDAWTKAGILHRDISVGNIMRVVDQADEKDLAVTGILNDWDLCKYKDELERPATQHNRSGTWAFMSAVALQYPFKPNELADDLESFIHVLTYCGLRFHRHSLTNHKIGQKLQQADLIKQNANNGRLSEYAWLYFEQSVDCGGGIYMGGREKLARIQIGSPDFSFSTGHVSPILVDLFDKLFRLLKTHYSTIDLKELEQYRGWPSSSLDPPPSQDTKDNSAVPVVRALNSLPKYVEHSDSEVEDSGEYEEGASEAAPRPVLRGRRALDTHAEIRKVFWKAAEQIRKARREGKFLEDVTQDQLLGLDELGAIPQKGLSGSKRKSAPSSIPKGNPKRMRPNEGSASHLDEVAEDTEEDDSDEDEWSVE
ncbi:hypothetical protein BC835DRAFT_1309836 [Cytidiella melzeri]|nr:hypothetical protein BC835DRAFT_1309836 [Cytidiella melzeri]